MIGDSLEILLIEDNPGDARLIREMIESIEPPERRFDGVIGSGAGVDDGPASTRDTGAPTVRHADRLEDGLGVLEDADIDIVLLDLNLPDSRGLDTLEAVLERARNLPVVVLTGMQDREIGLDALDQGAQEYLVKDEINADLLIRTVFHAIQRARYERELERQHERLANLYEIGMVVQGIGGSLIDYSTIEEIESGVCDRLVDSEAYRYAWIGEIDQGAGTVFPRTAAAPDGFLDDWTVPIDDGRDGGPISRAVHAEEVQFVQRAQENAEYGDWREHAREFDYRSVAAIPILYDDALYGILVVYADRPGAFEEEERGIVRRLGNVLGHAINAVERKAALMGAASIELELLLPDFIDYAGEGSSREDERIEFLTTIPAGDGSYLQYAEVEGFSDDGLVSVLQQLAEFENVREIEGEADRRLIEIQYSDPPIISRIATHGGRFRSASIEGTDYHVTIELPTDADVRSFIEAVRESYPDLNLVAQRSVESETSESSTFSTRDASLTDKQRAALEAAYFSGYFDRPRTSTGEEIAESLGITASTFHQHLQVGLRKLLAAEFEGRVQLEEDRSRSLAGRGQPFGDD